MTEFSFSDVSFPVRADIGEAHERAWGRLAESGCWWTAAERVAIAAEVRQAPRCKLCAESRQALSPRAVDGPHERASEILPEAAVEAVHRIVTDANRLGRSWLEKLTAEGLSDGHYVELVGVVVAVVSIDAFCRGVGSAPHPLPEPQAGEPSGYRPPGARPSEAWVPMIPERLASGAESDLYPFKPMGNVIKALSLVPDAVRQLTELSAAHYIPIRKMARFDVGRSIDRSQIELVAARVSALNECFY
jgi:hypothetical protein